MEVVREDPFDISDVPNPQGLLPPISYSVNYYVTAEVGAKYDQERIDRWNSETTERMCWDCAKNKKAIIATRFKIIGYWGLTLCEDCLPSFRDNGYC